MMRKMNKKVKFTTNTAFLLNMWFKEDSKMFKEARAFIEKAHEEHWKNNNSSFIEVTMKVKLLGGE